MKRIGLAIAAAVLGTTGLASAGIAVHQFSVASDTESAALDAKTGNLAANCWVATGAGKASGCNTAVSNPSLPGLPGLDSVTGLVDAEGLIDTAKGIAGEAAGAATAAAGTVPVNCDVSAGLPSAVNGAVGGVVPKEVSGVVNGAVNDALGTVGGTTGMNVGVNGSGTTGVGCSADSSGA